MLYGGLLSVSWSPLPSWNETLSKYIHFRYITFSTLKYSASCKTVLDDDMESLKHRISGLLEQQRESETAFAQQRAKFMELFKQKEGCT